MDDIERLNPTNSSVCFFFPWHSKEPVTFLFLRIVPGTFSVSRALFRCHGHFLKIVTGMSQALFRRIVTGRKKTIIIAGSF